MKPLHAKMDIDIPLSDEEFQQGYGAMLARRARAVTGLSQYEFAKNYGISLPSLKDWEQGRRIPNKTTLNYLRVIIKIPLAVAKALRQIA